MLRELTSLSFNINFNTLILFPCLRQGDWGASLHAEPKSALGSHIWTMGEPVVTHSLFQFQRNFTQLAFKGAQGTEGTFVPFDGLAKPPMHIHKLDASWEAQSFL